MLGTYVVVGATVLGALSCMLIAWSLWSRSQARKRARQRQLASGQYAVIPIQGQGQAPGLAPGQAPGLGPGQFAPGPAPGFEPEPRTEFMTTDQLFGQAGVPDEPTQFLTDDDLRAAGVQGGEFEPEDEHEVSTAFMTDEELFGEEDDEHEVATAFMTTDELFGAERGSASPATVTPRVDATVVLAEASIQPDPSPARPADPVPVHRAPRPSASRPTPMPQTPRKPAGPSGGYVGFVGDRANDPDPDDDDDDEFDDDDPETELVHQAELLRLISTTKPGSQ